ncbi:MAG TPA: hypothetical protein VM093_07125 [Aeromicrobium sp.]|nr:hypothetical protein [Aeromicrobium sp.]
MRWFFIVGGLAFLLAALYVRERPGAAADGMALTLGLIGFFWAVPQLVIMLAKRWRG